MAAAQQGQAALANVAALALPDGNLAILDQDLSALLTKNNVNQVLHQQLQSLGCTSISVFANWLEDRTGVRAAFMAATELRDDKGQEARLKQAWREADQITSEGLTRVGQNLAMQEVDAPLDDTLQKGLEAAFRTAYNWSKLDNRRMGSDNLLGRVSREFQRKQPTMFAVGRVKSLARAQMGSTSKRQRVADGIALEVFDGLGDITDDADTLAKWFRNLEVLSNTWALAGCFEVPWMGSRVKYAHWEATQAYVFDLRARLELPCPLYWPQGVLAYAVRVEEEFRGACLQLARNDPPVPWGICLSMALKENYSIWDSCKDTLGPKIPRQGDVMPDTGASSAMVPWFPSDNGQQMSKGKGKQKAQAQNLKGKAKGKGKQQQGPNRSKWATCNSASNGRWLCKKFNDKRGCRTPCVEGGYHACDCELTNGYCCEQTGHNRQNHSVAHNGAVKVSK